eukprot:3934966-Rhodomonas_salina.1
MHKLHSTLGLQSLKQSSVSASSSTSRYHCHSHLPYRDKGCLRCLKVLPDLTERLQRKVQRLGCTAADSDRRVQFSTRTRV